MKIIKLILCLFLLANTLANNEVEVRTKNTSNNSSQTENLIKTISELKNTIDNQKKILKKLRKKEHHGGRKKLNDFDSISDSSSSNLFTDQNDVRELTQVIDNNHMFYVVKKSSVDSIMNISTKKRKEDSKNLKKSL